MSDYTQLQADIVAMLARDDLETETFIRLAEIELSRLLRLRAMIATDTITVALTGDRYIGSLPSDFLEAFHVEQDDFRLEYRTPNGYDAEDDKIYTIVGAEIHVTGSEDVALWYYAKPTALSDSNTTNEFTDNAYDALLYLSLAHGGIYMGEIDKAEAWSAAGLRMAQNIQDTDRQAETSGAPLVQWGG